MSWRTAAVVTARCAYGDSSSTSAARRRRSYARYAASPEILRLGDATAFLCRCRVRRARLDPSVRIRRKCGCMGERPTRARGSTSTSSASTDASSRPRSRDPLEPADAKHTAAGGDVLTSAVYANIRGMRMRNLERERRSPAAGTALAWKQQCGYLRCGDTPRCPLVVRCDRHARAASHARFAIEGARVVGCRRSGCEARGVNCPRLDRFTGSGWQPSRSQAARS
jgi:hypothetical protein